MAIEIYSAFVKVGVSGSDAKVAVESINYATDKRYAAHAQQLAMCGVVGSVRKGVFEAETRLTRAVTEVQGSIADLQRRTIVAVFGGNAAFAASTRLWR